MKPNILFEDKNLLVFNKPTGWIVNEAQTTRSQPVLQKWLKDNFDYPLVKSSEFRSGIVHRIDKETSGILIVAKDEKTFKNLQSQFKKRQVNKTYTALVHGKIEIKKGSIEVPVGRLPWNRERFGVIAGGRKAKTNYQVDRYYQKGSSDYTLLELYPVTGRTHQIRIHLKYLGYPIVADQFYAGRKTAKLDRKWCPRFFLHASAISFKHPRSGKNVSYQAPLPSDLTKAQSFLK